MPTDIVALVPPTPVKEDNKPKTASENRTPITKRSFERASPY